jgi:hypothetical protein
LLAELFDQERGDGTRVRSRHAHTLYFTPPGNPAGVPPGPAHRFPEWGLCVGIL